MNLRLTLMHSHLTSDCREKRFDVSYVLLQPHPGKFAEAIQCKFWSMELNSPSVINWKKSTKTVELVFQLYERRLPLWTTASYDQTTNLKLYGLPISGHCLNEPSRPSFTLSEMMKSAKYYRRQLILSCKNLLVITTASTEVGLCSHEYDKLDEKISTLASHRINVW